MINLNRICDFFQPIYWCLKIILTILLTVKIVFETIFIQYMYTSIASLL
jgi:hypothetical protein